MHNITDVLFGRHLKRRREELSLSVSRLSGLSSISVERLQELERGQSRAEVEEVYNLSRELKVSIAYFYGDVMNTNNRSLH